MLDLGLSCSDATSALLGIFDFSIAPRLLFYAYIPIILIVLSLGVFVLIKDAYSLRSKLLFIISLVFTLFLLNEILQWIASPVSLVLLGWELVPIFRFLVAALTIYFIYVFIHKKDMPFIQKLILSFFFCSVLFVSTTTLNISYFDLDYCEGAPGLLWNFVSILSIPSILWIFWITYNGFKTSTSRDQKYTAIFLGLGGIGFLSIFFGATVWGDLTTFYDVALVGPVGMLIFMATLAYIIVKYNAFGIKLLGAQALMLTLWVQIGSLLFVAQSATTKAIAGFTLFAAIVLGMMLIRSIKRTVKQKEEIEKLAIKLEKANDQLKVLDKMKSEFVSIASHQLRSPLTSIRGYSSMLMEGSFGKLPPKAQEAIERISESSRFMASSVEDYLNVSRIQAGNMKYEYSDFNLKDIAERVADDTRQLALKKGLLLTFRSDLTKKGIVHADIGKTKQVIDNLINNSLKYTQKGSITVFVHDNPKKKKIYVDVSDTGIGMSPRTIDNIFGKFERAENANEVNVTGTGLGLYIAQKMAREMGGEVTASSEGEGKGSTFSVELPLQM